MSVILIAAFSSCIGSKPVAYFTQGSIDTSKIQNIDVPDQVIQKGDLLSITIFSDNPGATAIYNQAGGASSPAPSSVGVSRSVSPAQAGGASGAGYLVDNRGNIRLHAIGEIKAEGLTKDQLTDVVVERLKGLDVLTNPYTVVRFSNFKITILGEVRAPGVFTLPSEKASILEAIGLAGDITDYGLKDKVLLIREDQGKRTYHRINLLDPNIFASPLFYLKQNDVVLIESDHRKPTALDVQTLQYITVAATLASTAAILITLFR
jgi:polysaccharide export outer membrane protein